MKKILSESFFGQFLCSTSLGCPFTSLWEAFFVNYWAACTFSSNLLPNIILTCTSQQKVDTFFIFYTLKTEHSTPYIVLVSNSLMSMQVFLH